MKKSAPYSDKAILAAVRNDGSAGWELFCQQFDPLIRAIAKWAKWNFSEEEQRDVCQNIHMHLQTALPRFRGESSLLWYIKKIAMNQCVNEIRRQKRSRELMTSTFRKTADGIWKEMEFANPNAMDPHHETAQKERHQSLRAAVRSLNPTCRDGISMYYFQSLSYQEMSAQLGIAVNTVGSRLNKCLNKLHKELRRQPALNRINP